MGKKKGGKAKKKKPVSVAELDRRAGAKQLREEVLAKSRRELAALKTRKTRHGLQAKADVQPKRDDSISDMLVELEALNEGFQSLDEDSIKQILLNLEARSEADARRKLPTVAARVPTIFDEAKKTRHMQEASAAQFSPNPQDIVDKVMSSFDDMSAEAEYSTQDALLKLEANLETDLKQEHPELSGEALHLALQDKVEADAEWQRLNQESNTYTLMLTQ